VERIIGFRQALEAFATALSTQSQEHIKPLHRHIAMRLVCEGGFLPEEVTPTPPLRAIQRGSSWSLDHAPDVRNETELTVFGGMKTKKIDVVVVKPSIGPVLAVSVKGTANAYRNLTNRMEEAVGDSTNIHIMYPGMVYGFLHVLRANREADGFDRKDAGLLVDGTLSPMIDRYAAALREMACRRLVRDDPSGYEAVAVAVVETRPQDVGRVVGVPALRESAPELALETFFPTLYRVYDRRFPFRGESVAEAPRRCWSPDSPLFRKLEGELGATWQDELGIEARLAP